jgi:hypothetical protein
MGGIAETVTCIQLTKITRLHPLWQAPPSSGELIHDAERENGNIRFALIASYNASRQQEPVVAEPKEFQPFDLEAL